MKEHPVQNAACKRCHKDFTFIWPRVKAHYCSKECMIRAWRDKNREHIRELQKTYTENHREQRRQSRRKYHESPLGVQTNNGYIERNWERLKHEQRERYRNDEAFKTRLASRKSANKLLKASTRRYECEGCGKTSKLQCHHRNFNPLDNALENLMWLCVWCHSRLHIEVRDAEG